MKPPGIDLLVVDHQSPGDLDRMLRSIDAEDHDLAVWIGLVESPESVDVARTWYAETGCAGQLVNWVENIGYNRAINRLGTLGTHDIIACCNSDLIFTPHALSQLAWATDVHPDWGPVGPRQVDRTGRIVAGGIFGTQTRPRHAGWHTRNGHDQVRDDAIYVAGSMVCLRRDVWDQLTNCHQYRTACHEPQPGPWLDTQHYYGDSYLSIHAQAHGYRAVFYGTTTITHLLGASRLTDRDRPDVAHFRAACDAHEIPHE